LTAEQLQHARAAAWCQQGNPLLTADDATAWLREAGLALFLPRTAQIAAPAPSFVEATTGESNAIPKPAAIQSATSLLHRLTVSGDATALNLLGIAGDQPDFLVTEETLPFLFALRGDREWKRGPRGKSSPLVVEVWKLLDRDGALTADEIKDKLGRHLTESAALRALTDLWTNLRIEPIYSTEGDKNDSTQWQLLEANHEQAMIAGAAMSQGLALSGLVSLYLQSAIAATGDEIEAFLSPLASRSRIRDAVRGLMATRQLGIRNLGAHEHFFVEGSLPEFEELSKISNVSDVSTISTKTRGEAVQPVTPLADLLPEVPAPADIVMGGFRIEALSDSETEKERLVGDGRKRFVAQREGAASDRKNYGGRSSAERKTFGGERKTFGGARKTFGSREAPGSERKSFSSGPRSGGSSESAPQKPFFAREPWKEDRRPGGASSASPGGSSSGERRSFPDSDRKPFARPSAGNDRPYTPRENRPAPGGDRKPFARPSAGGDRPYPPREGGRPTFSGDRKPFARPSAGNDRPYTPREGGRPASSGDRKPFARPSAGNDRPYTPREGGRPASSGDRKPFARPSAGSDRPYTPREGGRPSSSGDRKPFTRPSAGSDRPFTPRENRPTANGSDRPYTPREGSRPYAPRGDRKPFTRPSAGGDRSYTPRPSGDGGMRPPRKPFAPREGSRPPGIDRGPSVPRDADRPARKPFSGGGEGERRPYTQRPEGGTPENRLGARPGKRPRTSPFTSSGKPRTGVGKPAGRPGPRAARPSAGFGGSKPGAGPRKDKPGGKGGGKSGPRRDG